MINSKPLTYLSNDPKELIPLTPAIFPREQIEVNMLDIESIEKTSMNRKIRHLQKICEDLRRRFRNEYLGQLKTLMKKEPNREVKMNEVVLVSDDNKKQLDWPLGRIVECFPAKDGQIRLVRVKTAKGQLLRPVQRVYPLEGVDNREHFHF